MKISRFHSPVAFTSIVIMMFAGTFSNSLCALPREGFAPVVTEPVNATVAATSLETKREQQKPKGIFFGPEDWVATVGSEEVKLWRARSLQTVCTFPLPASSNPHPEQSKTAFSATGDRVAVIVQNTRIEVHDSHNGELLLTLGSELFKADEEKYKQLKNAGIAVNTTRQLDAIAFSADGKRIFSAGSWDEPPRVWDATTGEMQLAFTNLRFYNRTRIAVSPDNHTFAVYGDGKIIVLDSATGLEKSRIESDASEVAFADEGKTLITTRYYDVTVRTYNCNTGKLLTFFPAPVEDRSNISYAISNQGKRLSVLHREGIGFGSSRNIVVDTWDIPSQKKLPSLIVPKHSEKLILNSFYGRMWDISENGTLIVLSTHAGDREAQSYVWQVASDKPELQLVGSMPTDAHVQERQESR